MRFMTGRCYDFEGPAEPVIATSAGWVALDELGASSLAASAMLLACSPEHVEQFRFNAPERAAAVALPADRT